MREEGGGGGGEETDEEGSFTPKTIVTVPGHQPYPNPRFGCVMVRGLVRNLITLLFWGVSFFSIHSKCVKTFSYVPISTEHVIYWLDKLIRVHFPR